MTTTMRSAVSCAIGIAVTTAVLGIFSSPAAGQITAPVTAPDPAQPSSSESLLAPPLACPGQLRTAAPRRVQAEVMFCLHQYARGQLGIGTYRLPGLNRSAKGKARDVMRCQQLSHSACGRGDFFWGRRYGLIKQCGRVSENLAYGSGSQGSPRGMMLRWLKSPHHRSILTNADNRWIGIAVATGRFQGRSKTNVWAAHFGISC